MNGVKNMVNERMDAKSRTKEWQRTSNGTVTGDGRNGDGWRMERRWATDGTAMGDRWNGDMRQAMDVGQNDDGRLTEQWQATNNKRETATEIGRNENKNWTNIGWKSNGRWMKIRQMLNKSQTEVRQTSNEHRMKIKWMLNESRRISGMTKRPTTMTNYNVVADECGNLWHNEGHHNRRVNMNATLQIAKRSAMDARYNSQRCKSIRSSVAKSCKSKNNNLKCFQHIQEPSRLLLCLCVCAKER